MNPFAFVRRRPLTALMLVVASAGAVVFSLYKMRVDIPSLHTEQIYERLDDMAIHVQHAREQVFGKDKSKSGEGEKEERGEEHKIVVTSPEAKDVLTTQKYVCQIHSQKHIEVCALEGGYLEQIFVREGQAVKKDDMLFKILPPLFEAKLAAKTAEADLAELEFNYSKQLSARKVVSENEVALKKAKLAHAKAEAQLASAELNFTNIRAPFDGIVDRLREQLGSLIKEGDILTTLSDNRLMWVYFNVPEADYLEYMAFQGKREEDERIELKLPGGKTFKHTGKIGAIEAKFNNENGNIAFRADFPNPEGLLRHGQTGTVLIHHTLKNAIVIPQRAKFEILAKQYVYVISDEEGSHATAGDRDDDDGHDAKDDDDHDDDDDDDHDAKGDDRDDDDDHDDHDAKGDDGHKKHGVVRQREIVILHELDDIYVIKEGLKVGDKIILEGIRQVSDGDKVEYEFLPPEKALGHLKFHAE